MEGLVAVIFALCAASTTSSDDYMVRCFDYYTNCVVGKGGKVDPNSVKECKDHLPKDLQ